MPNRLSSRARTTLAAALAGLLAVTLLGPQPAIAAKPKPYVPPAAPAMPAIKVRTGSALAPAATRIATAAKAPAPVWPAASSRTVAPGAAAGPVTVRAAGPVAKSAVPGSIKVDVLDQAASARADVRGLLIRVGRADGKTAAASTSVAVSYGGFATAYGGDWASRLRMVRLPECALTTPQRSECAGVPLPTDNNLAAKQATATVATGAGQLLALAAAPSGPNGSFGATSLTASGSWSAGSSSGNFSWSYPMRTPPAMGGPVPTLELGYSAQSVDGRMAAANSQPSVAGEGFELATGGFIERRYKSCSDDTDGGNNASGAAKTADDECWATDNATLSLNGSGGELIKEPAPSNIWHLRNDDGSKIEHKFNAANGAQGGEWWVVTTVNGTQYWFGKNKLPGASATDATNSTWTVPVFGNQPDEPCHAATFAASSCVQAWRWNLDYVVDPHANTMSYWYGKPETNNYQSGTGKVQSYTRGGFLDHVSYGTRVEPDLATGKDTVFTGHAAAAVDFDYDDRCLSNCGTHDESHWPDTPWDLSCSDDTHCDAPMPSFWTTRRLSAITTSVFNVITGKYPPVERWTLTHGFPSAQDNTHPGLWLEKIGHAGLEGTTTTLPDVTFAGTPMPNRVDGVDHAAPMNWPRLTDINSETGAIVHVDYLPSDCVAGSHVPTSPETNTLRCYPVKWAAPGFPKATDYFNKYVVNEVTETDRTGGSTRVLHHYSYLSDPAWHYADDDGLIADDAKTWSDWRGYQKVAVTTGDPGGQTYTETTFFRGMNGDHLPKGSRTASVPDSQGGSVPDDDTFAGMVRETRTLLGGPGGAEVSGEIHDPWQSAPTATRTIDGVTVNARFVNTEGTHSRVTLDHAPWTRTTYTRSTFDKYGMVVREDDSGDEAVTGDEQCVATTFEPRNTDVWIMSLPHRIQTYALGCAQVDKGPVTEADVIGDARNYYDGATVSGTAPKLGDVTKTEQMDTWNNGSPTYAQVSRTQYDALGRSTDSWDALDRHSGTTYTPVITGPVTSTVDTNPLGWTTTTTVDPAWGLVMTSEDTNKLRTEQAYDGLGRLIKVWQPGRTQAAGDTPDIEYAYTIRTDGVNAVTTRHVNPKGTTTTSYTLYDGLLRTRQTQTASPTGGRILTDTKYDAAGRVVEDYGAYYDPTGAPGVNLATPLAVEDVPNQTRTVYDGAGRVAATVFEPNLKERWRTTTTYGGDHIDVSPPQGATATSTWTDARGRKVQLRTYPTRTATGDDYDHTDYHYNRKGLMDTVTGPDRSVWSYGYDLRGRKTSSADPDAGTTTTRYDNASRATGTTGPNGSLTMTYDKLDRKIGLYKGTTVTSTGQLAQWDYDRSTLPDGTTMLNGPLTQTSRIVGTSRYTVGTSQYDTQYRPLSTKVTVPSAEAGLKGSYIFGTGYNQDGSVSGVSYPPTGDLEAETLLVDYTDFGQPLDMVNFYGDGVESSIVSDSHYDALAHPTQYTLYTGLISGRGSRAYLSYETDAVTGRLMEISAHRDGVSPNTVTDQHYTYDDAGNITKMADTPTGGGYSDVQCFSYDRYQHLKEAWTPAADDCAAAPANASLGGPAPYWQSYDYTAAGARGKLTDHATPAGDVTTTYQYTDAAPDDPATGQPHTLAGTTTTDSTGTRTSAYTYDKAGQTKTRPGPHGTQTLTWDVEGNLQSVTDTAGTVSYLYDADGNRLISRDTTGQTLYLPGEELRHTNSTGLNACTRYYTYAGGTVAQRTAGGLTWLAGDHQGTQEVTIDAATQASSIRRQTPFGTPRGPQVSWPNDKGFIGGTADPTGLTHLGAREYDPQLGRFLSTDPVLDTGDPQQLEGYSYADNDPVVHADPTGEMFPKDDAPGRTPTPDDLVYPQTTNPAPSQPSTPKKCGWGCKFKKGFTAGANWVDDHKAVIAGAVVGTVVGLGCEAVFGVTGPVGAVACGAAAGAIGNMVTYAVETEVEHKGNFSLGGMAVQGAIGAVVGGAMGGLGSVAGSAIKSGVSSLMSRAGSGVAARAAAPAMEKEAASAVSTLAENAVAKSPAKAAAGAAESAFRGGSQSAPGGQAGAAASVSGLKRALGAVGMSIRKYDVVHVQPEDEAAYGLAGNWGVSRFLNGLAERGPSGRPAIFLSNRGLSSMNEGVATVFHEIYHHESMAAFGHTGTEAQAEEFGQRMLNEFLRRTS